MGILFNKASKGTEELKTRIGFLYKSEVFANIKPDIEIATEDIIKLVGQALYDRAETHYKTSGYKEDPSDATAVINDKLVHHLQFPIGFHAIKSFFENSDVSHEGSGRRAKVENENEKLPWEWMIDRDDEAILKKAYKYTDRLIDFLEKNVDDISEWKNSDARKSYLSLFVKNADQFDSIFPIDKSRRFYILVAPFMKEVERKYIKPAITADVFDSLKTELKSATGISEANEELYEYICNVIPFFTMSIAVKRLSLQVIPEGVIRNMMSDRMTTKGKLLPEMQFIQLVSKELEEEGVRELNMLHEYLLKIETVAAGETYETVIETLETNKTTNKFFTT